jgi:hypothetical protein
MYLQVCGGEEKGGNTCARLASPGRGMGRRWGRARVHDVHMNSPPKYGPKLPRSAASF